MKQIKRKFKYIPVISALLISFSVISLAPNVYAQSLFSGAKGEACAGAQLRPVSQGGDPNCTQDDETSLSNTLSNGIDLVSIVVGIIAVIMIIIGGIRFIVSDGDSGKVTTARNTIIYALVGLILVAFAQIIVKFVLARV